MTISTCVAGLVAEGRIPAGKAAEADRLYSKHLAVLKHTMGVSAAATEASERTIRALEAQALHRKRQALLLAKKQMDMQGRFALARPVDADGRLGPIPKAAAFEEIRGLDADMGSIIAQANGMIVGFLAKFRRNLFGQVRNKADLDNVGREIFGQSTGDASAKAMADALMRTMEWLRSRFNAAGGAIAKLESFGLPQHHSADLVATAEREPWKAFVLPKLDRAKMIDWETGLPMTDKALDDLLSQIWDTISTGGWDRREPGVMGTAALGNQRQEHRVLHFQDADQWMAYHERFGGGATILDVMNTHIRSMARDIAAMERMGPNPAATLAMMQGVMKKSGKEWVTANGVLPEVSRFSRVFKGSALHQAAGNELNGTAHLQRLFNEYSGKNGISENPRMTLAFGTLSTLQVAAKLTATTVKSLPDVATMALTAWNNDLPVLGMLKGYVSRVLPHSEADAIHVARLGIISEDWTRIIRGDWRLSGEELGSEVARQVADTVLRASFLNRLSDSVRKTFAAEMWNTITQERGKAFADLDGKFAAMMQRYGIDAARWDQLRATPLESYKGMDWIYPDRIEDAALRDAVFAMTHREVQHALITSDIDSRALIGQFARGTWIGELTRSAFLFKQFPMTMASLHGRRMMQQSTLPAKFAYFAVGLGMLTFGGALSRQLYSVAVNGRDPEDMTDLNFWKRAMLDGGGLGIYGDFIRNSESRVGGGIGQTVVGPLIGSTLTNLGTMVVGNTAAALDSDPDTETQWGRDLTNFAITETPGLSMWYTRVAVNRLLLDQLREWSDPNYDRKIAAAYRRADNEGTSFYAGPGAVTGSGPGVRMPDFGNAIGMPSAPENVARVEAN
jgi:hypothetical protein